MTDSEVSDKPIDSAVLIRMKQFRAMNKLKKLALKVVTDTPSSKMISKTLNLTVVFCLIGHS